MMERLYIDDVLVDVGKDTNITVSLVSNLFSDVTKMAGNASYTIKLPRTSQNMKVFGYADRVDSTSTIAYQKHKARFYRNGVELFKDADAVLQSSGAEGYELVVVWGCRPQFSSFLEKNMSIRDLTSQARVLFGQQPEWTEYDDFVLHGYGYPMMWVKYDAEETDEWKGRNYIGNWDEVQDVATITKETEGTSGESETAPRRLFISSEYIHPTVMVKWILARILDDTGIEFKWSGDAKALVESLAIPCISKDANGLTFTNDKLTATVVEQPGAYGKVLMQCAASGSVFGTLYEQTDTVTVLTSSELMVEARLEIKHKWRDIFERIESTVGQMLVGQGYKNYMKPTEVNIVVHHQSGSDDVYRIGNGGKMFVGNLYDKELGLVEVLEGKGKISVEQGDEISMRLESIGYISYRQARITGGFMATATAGDSVPYGAWFPIVENLPDVKVVDMVKFLCAVTGTFPLQKSSGGVVEFAEYDVLMDNISRALDWSDKLRPGARANIPSKIAYKMDGWAKHNYYRWKDDEKVRGRYDGDLVVYNDVLDEERTVITFPFAASDESLGTAEVPMYEKEEREEEGQIVTEYNYDKCEPRIVSISGSGQSMVGTRFRMNMQSIIDEKYGVIAGALMDAKVIEETVELTDREVAEFDETVPVWLAQYGSYFAVLEIKSGSDGMSTAKMIKIRQDYSDMPTPPIPPAPDVENYIVSDEVFVVTDNGGSGFVVQSINQI